jgi:hypothetical protein
LDGSGNNALGQYALGDNQSGNDNTAVGSSAGSNLVSGSNNIAIGANTTFASTTTDNQLNIGNSLYGDVSTHQLNLGSSTLVSGISLDVGSKTDSIRPAVGTTAQEPVCDSTRIGAMRYDTSVNYMMVCTDTGWRPLSMSSGSGGGAPSTPPSGTGYFVVTYGTWNGNLGDLAGANSKCLSDLTTYNWLNKSDAVSRGILNATNVKAWIYAIKRYANLPLPSTTYTRSPHPGYSSTGGATFITDSSYRLPSNAQDWSGSELLRIRSTILVKHWIYNI